MPEVRQGIPLAEEHEEPFEGRVRQGAEGVLAPTVRIEPNTRAVCRSTF